MGDEHTDDTSPSAFTWYVRGGVDPDPDTVALCSRHAAEVVALGVGYQPGRPRARWAADLPAAPSRCAVCSGTTSLDELARCRCHVLGDACPVHRPPAVGVAGEMVHVQCIKCGAEIGLPADRVAFERGDAGVGAVDVTGWARRQGAGDALLCPFHGPGMTYHLEPLGDDQVAEDDEDDDDDDDDDDEDDEDDEDDDASGSR